MDMTEEITRYVLGGYRPIIIGNILNGSYRIVHKLGWGSYVTVGQTQEASILRTIFSPHVVILLDHFTLQGPNGTDLILVTDVVASIRSTLPRSSSPQARSRKNIARDLASGPWSNIGLDMSELANQNPSQADTNLPLSQLRLRINNPLLYHLMSFRHALSIGKHYHEIVRSGVYRTKVIDFGTVHYAGTILSNPRCVTSACPPEVAFARFINKIENLRAEPPADIWAFGTAIFELVTGSPLYNGNLPYSMVEMTGDVPSSWQNWYDSLSKPPNVSPGAADRWWASRWKAL
ncbi:hypothetical protein M422DRAFT_266076 [Sphaerobolus stellatus SS14]|uniref:non-specific serine/threonine protein kinase n=1 Tax=Sphaerobolus stellatus (strain SS14) TaxID=990650 RepID=A0A0C9V3P8_SPHS4|nr:hypothetical protein M422DRAFT_266076 [Sphaerobolus stellatus SS14]